MVATKLVASFTGNTLSIDDRHVEFEAPIDKIIKVGGAVLVLLNYDFISKSDPNFERNVAAVDAEGTILWRIERRVGPTIGPNHTAILNPYVGMGWDDKKEKIVVYDMGGLCFDLDVETGRISNPVFTR